MLQSKARLAPGFFFSPATRNMCGERTAMRNPEHAIDMDAVFSVEAWSAFAPGLDDAAAWSAWARAPWLPHGDDVPALVEMAPMQRRRVERLGRAALQVAWRCQGDDQRDIPLVFATRHGDLSRTHQMLAELARDQPLSPTQFGLSTHNAIPAQYSIARVLIGHYSVVSAGAASVEAAIVEAQALLADGAPAVLVTVFDAPTPGDFAHYRDEPEAWYAWAWRVVPARDGLPTFSLQPGMAKASAILPHGLEVLRFFLAGEPELTGGDGGGWTRHG